MNKNLFLLLCTIISLQNSPIIVAHEKEPSQEELVQEQKPMHSAEYQAAMNAFIDETFDQIKHQTESIKFCLQTIEIIANTDKIKFDATKITKSQFLQETREIKSLVNAIDDFYSHQMSKGEGVVHGVYFNQIMLEYLLDTLEKDFTSLNIKDFDQHIGEKIEKGIQIQSLDEITEMVKNNDHNIEKLKDFCDNIGLTTFHRWYRYLENEPLSWTGKPLLHTIKNVAFWGTAGVVAYSVLTYCLPRNAEVLGTSTLYDPKKDDNISNSIPDVEKPTAKSTLGEVGKAAAQYMKSEQKDFEAAQQKTFTWEDADKKIYRRKKVNEIFFGKNWLGDCQEVRDLHTKSSTEDQKKHLEKGFGVYSHIHNGVLTYSDPFVLGFVGLIGYYVKQDLQELYKNTTQAIEKFINTHLRGDVSPLRSANEIPKTYFNEFVGGEHLERLALELVDYLKNPTRYERQGIPPATGILLVGPPQSGKSFFAKALKTLIEEAFADQPDSVKFFSINPDDLAYYGGFARIFALARKDSPCILFIDELDMYGARRDKNTQNTQELLTSMNGLDTDPNKKVIVIAATNKPEEIDFALKQKGRFGKIITFDYPTYECRKEYLEKQLQKKNIALNSNMIDTIAQESDGHTFNMIDDIIRQALQQATYETRTVNERDFEVTLDREIRKIKPNITISEQEKELVAIYQAGQAVARHILKTEQQIVKITIDSVDKTFKSKEGVGFISEQKGMQHENLELLPQNRIKNSRLGYVFTMSKTNNKELINDEEQQKELLALLAGNAALELVKKHKYTEFGKEDRAKILAELEKKISQGNPITNKIRAEAIEEKDALYLIIKNMLNNHVGFIETIAQELMKKTTLNQKQWETLASNYQV